MCTWTEAEQQKHENGERQQQRGPKAVTSKANLVANDQRRTRESGKPEAEAHTTERNVREKCEGSGFLFRPSILRAARNPLCFAPCWAFCAGCGEEGDRRRTGSHCRWCVTVRRYGQPRTRTHQKKGEERAQKVVTICGDVR